MAEPTDVQRRLAAVFAADVEGYSRLMGADEVGTLKGLTRRRAILDKAIADHRGRIANTAGDSVLAEFGSAVDAVQCAVEAQAALAEANASLPTDKRINFRIGIHVGDVMVRAGDLFGDGVNIAARLQTLAQAGGVCVSGTAHEHVRKVLPFAFTDLGAQQVKNIEEPVRAYAISGPAAVARSPDASVPLPLPDKPSIAVLPFQNMSGDPEQEYFADGMVEEIITALSRFKSLFVIARNSSFTYRGRAVDIKQVGRELGVRYVLEGSVRKSAGRVRITGQLIEAATGAHLWADKFDGSLEDVFDLQDRITSTVVSVVAKKIEHVEVERARQRPTANLRAYDLYLKAIDAFNLYTREASDEAVQLLSRAIELDPSFTEAMGRLCSVYSSRAYQNWMVRSDNEVERATQLARRVLDVEKEDAAALCAAGFLLGSLTNEWQVSIAVQHQSLQLNPNLAQAHISVGMLRVVRGEMQPAIENFLNARRLNPYDPRESQTLLGLAVAHFFMGQHDEAAEWIEKALANNVRARSIMRWGIAILATAGHLERARENLQTLLKVSPDEGISTTIPIHLHTLNTEERKQKLLAGLRAAGFPE